MIRIFKLVVLLVISQVAFGQAPSNYTNINGRYRWIAGMFDSTFHIPKGTNPSLRTGGSTNAGGLFYNTSDSSVYTYTGTQWIKVRGSINPSDTTNKYVTQVYKKNASDSVFYVKGGNHIWAFNDSTGSPGGGGGGKIYYFNGGVSMGTFGGFTMYELGDTANTGTAANFTRATTGNIANFITDPGKPGLVQIPAGVWSVDAWLSETGGGANHAEIWIEVEKWDGSTITTIATSPIEQITEGATPNLYSWSVTIPTTSLAITDRIVIQFYISNTNGKTVTLYTQNGYVGEVHTTFTTGIGAINGLTAPAQYLVTGTSGTDFNINSATATHTFNLPTASATNRGALSTTDWSTFNSKIGPSDTASMLSPYFRLAGVGLKNTGQTVYADTLLLSTRAWRQKGIDSVAALINSNVSGTTNYVAKFTGSNTIGNSQIIDNGTAVAIGTAASNAYKLSVAGIYRGVGVGDAARIELFDTQVGGATFFVNPQQSLGVTSLGTYGAFPISFVTNNSEKARLTSAGNFGIGTTSVDSLLTVEQGAWVKRGLRLSGLPTGTGTKNLRVDANGTVSLADTLANGISGTGTTNYIPKFTSSSAIGNSLVYETGTHIVVNGTTNGTALNTSVTVNDPNASNYSGFIPMTANTQRGYYGGTSTGLEIGTSGLLAIWTGGSERLRISSTGNVSIGNTNNTYNLDVTGTGYFSGNVDIGTGDSRLTIGNTSLANTEAKVRLRTGSTKIAWEIGGQSLVDNALTITPSTAAGGTTFTTPVLTLNSSGNLGLGVSPSAWNSVFKVLESGDSNNQTAVAFQNNANVIYLTTNSYFDASWKYKFSDNAGQYLIDGNEHRWYNAPSGTAGNAISFTQAMTLDASGRLGIGTTSPQSILQIKGAFNIERSNTTDYSIIDNEGNLNIKAATGGGGGSFNTVFFTGGSERMRITSGGQVNINTSNPSGRYLSIGGDISVGSNNTNTYELLLQMNSSYARIGPTYQTGGSYVPLTFWTSDAERMRITSGGAVGIATTTPGTGSGAKLEVVQGTSTNTVARLIGPSLKTSTTQEYPLYITTSEAWASNPFGFEFGLKGNATSSSRVGYIQMVTVNSSNDGILALNPSGGNVGIGTSSPAQKLTLVNGTFQIGGTSTFSDNVEIGRVGGDNNMAFATGGSERMRITSAGLVGIGTTSPTSYGATYTTLAVNGSSSGVIDVMGNGTVYGQLSTSTNIFSIEARGASTATRFITNGDERMRITSGGLVGIGTSAPDVALHIYKTPSTNDAASYNLVLQDPTAIASRVGSGISFGGFYDATNTTLTFANIKGYKENTTSGDYAGALAFITRVNGGNPTERMKIRSTGQVRFVPLASDPAGAESGDVYYNSTTNKLKVYNGTSWIDLH